MKLNIRNFSCIKDVEFEVKDFNVIIGPQASGKSLISKILYFFNTLKLDQTESIKSLKSFETYSDEVKEKFIKWFPISAWGSEIFNIKFDAGDYKITIIRVSHNGRISNTLKMIFSQSIKDTHRIGSDLYRKLEKKYREEENEDDFFEKVQLERYADRQINSISRKSLSDNYIDVLTYIPAGRSFFTNLGKALLAFEQTNLLDPVSVDFGKLYTSFIQNFNLLQRKINRGTVSFISSIIGGEIVFEKGSFYVKYEDGRKIPFSNLSSGQQELMPLLMAFSSISPTNNSPQSIESRNYLTFIEEPEAHLFPDAQSRIIEGFSKYIQSSAYNRRKIIITTHSPYVLSKINNLLKAGSLYKEFRKNKEKIELLNQTIPRATSINPARFTANALINGKFVKIIDNYGLIDAEYLDEVSNEINSEFARLLELEFE